MGTAANSLDLQVRNLAVTTAGSNQFLSEQDDLSSLTLSAGTGNITLSAGGQIQDGDSALDIQAATLTLTAQAAGTVASRLQTQIASLTATATSGDLYLTEADGLTILSASALAAGGDIGITSLLGNLSIVSLQAQNLVSLVAQSGAILRAGAAPVNIAASDLEMAAASGIGASTSPLVTTVNRLEASGGSGGIFLHNTQNLQVGGISPSLLNLTGLSAATADIVVSASGSLTTVESIQTTGGGPIGLTADRSIRLGSGASVTTVSGSISLLANADGTPAAGTFSGITLDGATVSSQTGNITAIGNAGISGHGLLIQNGSSLGSTGTGNVLLAGMGAGGLADIAWDSLTIAKSGGSYTFQDTVQGDELFILPGNYQVRFLDGGFIASGVNFQNTGGVILGDEDGDVLTFAGGLTSTAGPTTVQGTTATQGTDIVLGTTTLVSTATLLTGGGDVTIGQIFAAGVPLTIDAASGDVSLANPANVIGNLTIHADELTLAENDDITQAGAWTTTGQTILSAAGHDILLTNPGNVLGPLEVTADSVSIVESGDTELAAATWNGTLTVTMAGNLLVGGLLTGSGSASLSSGGQISFTNGGQLVAQGSVDVELTAAAGGIGTSASPLATTVNRLEASGGSGGIFLENTQDLQIGGIGPSLLSLTGLSSSEGDIIVSAAGAIVTTEEIANPQSGAITLRAETDLTIGASVSGQDGPITFSAGGDVVALARITVTTRSGTILILADSDRDAGGTIQFGADIELGTGRVIFSLPDADGLLTGSIRGEGSFYKQGPGTLTIGGDSKNSYTGTTDVLAGTLRVDGTIGAGGPAGVLTIADRAILTGGGNIVAPIFSASTGATIVSGGNLSLGDGSRAGFDFQGRLLIDGGDQVLIRDADLAQLGILTAIGRGSRLTADGGVEVGAHDRLIGSGAVSGVVIVLSGGEVSPGPTTGVLATESGDWTLFAGAIYVVDLNGGEPGSGHDQINVQGTVSVDGAIFSISGGSFRPREGSVFTLIANDGTDPVLGQLVTASGTVLGEGAKILFGGIEASISYVGGEGGNDVTLTIEDLKFVRTISTELQVAIAAPGTGNELQITRRELPLAPAMISETPQPRDSSRTTDVRAAALESRRTERLRVFFRVVNAATGVEEEREYALDPEVLRDLLGIFKKVRFQDGRYRVYFQEPGKSARLILDVNVLDGKVVPPNFRDFEVPESAPGQPGPAAAPAEEPAAPRDEAAPREEQPPAQAPSAADRADSGHGQPEHVLVATAHVPPSAIPMVPGSMIPDDSRDSGRPTSRWHFAAAGASVGLAALGRIPWRDRVQAVLASGDIPGTRVGRLLRRLRERS